jgi:hypothetical protein
VQREGDVIHVVVESFQGLDEELDGLRPRSRDFR